MSRRVVGYDRNRRPIWADDGPAVGRVQGFGGVAAGHFTGTVVVPQPVRTKLPRQPLSVTRPRPDPEARDRRSR
jgi:hypothetical protein